MTDSDWNTVFRGDPDREVVVNGEHTMVRYVVVDALDEHAKELGKRGRPDRAALLRSVSSIRAGRAPSKKTLDKAHSELSVVKERIVDGKRLKDA